MALSDEQKKEMQDIFSDAFSEGLKKFRSFVEEEDAKKTPPAPPTSDGGNNSDGASFSLGSWLLGGDGK